MTLNELNFKKLISIDYHNINNYSFDEYKVNGYKHPRIIDCCTLCEEKGLKYCDDSKYHLKNLSHGAHSSDFSKSLKQQLNTDGWNDSGVMFVMENPSINYGGMYEEIKINRNGFELKKSPVVEWYWVHEDLDYCEYPENFKGKKYGELVESAILTFKLKNAYLTNLVKCGLNDDDNHYKGIDSMSEGCINNCINEYLKNEIEILNPKVIFTFGSNGYYYANLFFGNKYKVVGLPHPAGAQRGFKNEYYNVLYFCMMSKWLYKTGVINEEFYNKMMKLFAIND